MGFLDKIQAARSLQPKEKSLAKSAQRILALTRKQYSPLDTTPWELANCSIDLFPIQRKALSAIYENGGAFFPIGVGHGKTFISVLAPVVRGKKHAIIVAPSATLPNIRTHIGIIDNNFKHNTVFTVISYGDLSKTGSSGLLEALHRAPANDTMLICDEAHKLKRIESARTKRVIRFLKANQEIEVVMLSGTMTNRTLKDYAHLIALCLREKTPLPLVKRELESWCSVIDVEGECEQHCMIDVADVLKKYDPTLSSHDMPATRKKKARKAFAKHLRGAQGVVGTHQSAIGTSLLIHQLYKGVGFTDDLNKVFKMVRESGDSPDGEITYESPADLARALKQISLGFFYKWDWPNGQIDLEWMEARSTWNRLVRNELSYSACEGYDSPALVWEVVADAWNDNTPLARAWVHWNKHRHKKPPPIKTTWLSENVIFEMAKFARQNDCSIWYQSKAVADMLESYNIPVYRSGDEIDTENLPDIQYFSTWNRTKSTIIRQCANH